MFKTLNEQNHARTRTNPYETTYELFVRGNMCLKNMHLYVVWVSTYFSIITVCPCLLLIFSFLNQVSASLTKAQIPLKLGTPEILC